MFLSLPILLAIGGGFIFLSAVANALSLEDRSFYTFFVRFMRLLTLNLAPIVTKELGAAGITLPTQVDVSIPASTTTLSTTTSTK
jgi:hypothetical protein